MVFRSRIFLVAISLSAGVASTYAQDVYVASSNGQFGQLDVSTGAYTLINLSPYLIGGVGYGSGGQLFALANNTNLYKVDGSGNLTLVGASGMSLAGGWGMGGASDGTLYGQGAGVLSTLDESTGAATSVGSIGFTTGAVPVEDGAGNLYLNNTGNGNLNLINKITGAGTEIGHLSTGGNVDAMAWTNGHLYAIDFAGDIYTVNTSTAATTLVATYDTSKAGTIWAAASNFQAVPEPAPFAILGLGVAALVRRRSK